MKPTFRNSPLNFGLANLAIMLPSTAFSLFYTYYYVEKLALPLALFTLGRSIYVVWDAAVQPVSGYLSDRTRTRWGRRKPWIVAGIPVYIVSFVLLYSAPRFDDDISLFIWFLSFQLLFEASMAIISVNYLSLLPELFTSDTQRAKASLVQQVCYIIALLVGTGLTPLLYEAIGFQGMAMLYAAAFGVLMIISMAFTRENPAAAAAEPLGLLDSFRVTLRNGPFWWFNLSFMFSAAVLGLISTTIAFYAKYVLHLADASVSLLLMATFVSVIPMAYLWYRVVQRTTPLTCYLVSIAGFIASVVPLFFARDLLGGIIAGVVLSAGLAGHFVIPNLVLSQIIDRDAQATGRRREGIYMAVSNFIVRTSALLTALSFWLVGTLFGYESGEHPGSNPVATFVILTALIPMLMLLISLALALKLRRPQQHAESSSGASEASGTETRPA